MHGVPPITSIIFVLLTRAKFLGSFNHKTLGIVCYILAMLISWVKHGFSIIMSVAMVLVTYIM